MMYAEEYSVLHSKVAKSMRALLSLMNICWSIGKAKKRWPLRSTIFAPSAKRSSWNLCSNFAIWFGQPIDGLVHTTYAVLVWLLKIKERVSSLFYFPFCVCQWGPVGTAYHASPFSYTQRPAWALVSHLYIILKFKFRVQKFEKQISNCFPPAKAGGTF